MLVVENLENTKNYSEQNKTKITQGIITEEFILVFFFFFFLQSQAKQFFLSLFIWLCWVFVAARGPFLVAASEGHSSLRCAGAWALGTRASAAVAHGGLSSCGSRAPERSSSSCGARAHHVRSSRTRARTHVPALAGRLPTTAPPGKSLVCFFQVFFLCLFYGFFFFHYMI